MSYTFIQKAKRILGGLEYGAFITAKEWESENFEYYFKYFSSSDVEIRKYSLLVFAAGIGNWYSKSAFIFLPLVELQKDPMYDPNAAYYFPDYIDSFLKSRESIESDYPELYSMIVLFLIELDNNEPFDTMFTEYELFKRLRRVLNNSGLGNRFRYVDFDKFLYDMDLPNFYNHK